MVSHGSRGRVLVVDENDDTRLLLTALLRGLGHEVEDVADGEAALELLAGTPFHAVLLDVDLQRGSGMDLLARARARAPGTAFVMLTSFASIDSAVTAVQDGAFGYLRKPLHAEELQHVIRHALAEAGVRDAAAAPALAGVAATTIRSH